MKRYAGAVLWVVAVACVRPPAVVLVDRKTALEEQAAGEYPDQERALEQAGLSPRPLLMTRGQIEAAGSSSSFETVVRTYQSLRTDQPMVDALLVRRCLGEGLDGLLAQTRETCAGEVDPSVLGPLVQRVNRDRRQLWAFMMSRSGGATEEDVRRSWREKHLLMVVCGGQVQQADGTWGVKRCDEK